MKNPIFVLAASALLFGYTQTYAQVTDSTKAVPSGSAKATTTAPGATTPSTTSGTPNTATQSAAASQDTSAASGDVIQAITKTGYTAMLATTIKTAGLESALQGAGPYTVFAPSDQAFTQSASDSTLKNPAVLTKVLRNHIVQGKYTKDDVIKALTAGKGTATLTTIDGNKLTLKVNANKNLELSDSEGHTALVTAFDQMASNGVVHVINNILVPKNSNL